MRNQPQGRAIAGSEWRGLGLANYNLFQASDFDAAGPNALSRNGTSHALKASAFGLGVSQNGSANFWTTGGIGRLISPGGNQFAVMLTFQLNTTGQASRYLLIEGSGTPQTAVIYGYVANTVEFFVQGYGGTDPRTGSQIVVADTLPHTIIYTYDGVTFRGFLDGIEKFAITKTFTLPAPQSAGVIGAASGAGASASNATFLAHARFTKGLPREAARMLSANPWLPLNAPSNAPLMGLLGGVSTTPPSSATAAMSWTEADDGALATATVTNRAGAAWTEADDAVAAAALVTNRASAGWTEAGDTIAIAATAITAMPSQTDASATIAWTEAGDSAVLAGQLRDRASVAWTEQGETFSITGVSSTPPIVVASVRFRTLPRDFGMKTIHYSN
jgi:hypothetical protein